MADKKYSKDHIWVMQEGDRCIMGLTRHGQKQLKDIVFADMASPGTKIGKGEKFASLESVKTVSEALSPLSGKIIEINPEVEDDCGIINEKPEEAWLVKLEMSDKKELESLMTKSEYEKKNP